MSPGATSSYKQQLKPLSYNTNSLPLRQKRAPGLKTNAKQDYMSFQPYLPPPPTVSRHLLRDTSNQNITDTRSDHNSELHGLSQKLSSNKHSTKGFEGMGNHSPAALKPLQTSKDCRRTRHEANKSQNTDLSSLKGTSL